MNDHHLLLHGHQGQVTCTELHSTTHDHSGSPELDFDLILYDASNDCSPLPSHNESNSVSQDRLTYQTSDDINFPLSQDIISTADLSVSYIQEEMIEPLFDDAPVSNSTFVEAPNVPITNEAAVFCEQFVFECMFLY